MNQPKQPDARELLESVLNDPQRDLSALPRSAIDEVRDLVKRPAQAVAVLGDRLAVACQQDPDTWTERHWQLFELLINAWECCNVMLIRYRREMHDYVLWQLRHNEEYRESQRRLNRLIASSKAEIVRDEPQRKPKQQTSFLGQAKG